MYERESTIKHERKPPRKLRITCPWSYIEAQCWSTSKISAPMNSSKLLDTNLRLASFRITILQHEKNYYPNGIMLVSVEKDSFKAQMSELLRGCALTLSLRILRLHKVKG
jgi:hypothetical protein